MNQKWVEFWDAHKERATFKFIQNTADNGDAVVLAPYETQVAIDNDGAYTQSVQLPHSSECPLGQIININVIDVGGGGTISDHDESQEWSDLTMNADGEMAVILNTAQGWKTIYTDM